MLIDRVQRKLAVCKATLLRHGAKALNTGAKRWFAGRRQWRWLGMFHAAEALVSGAPQVYQAEVRRRHPR